MTANTREMYQTESVATATRRAETVPVELSWLYCNVVAVTLARKAALADRLMFMVVRPSFCCASRIWAIPGAW